MLRKGQVLTVVAIAVVSFLIGTTFSVMTMATDGGNPFDTIWEAIIGLQSETSQLRTDCNNLMDDFMDLRFLCEELKNNLTELTLQYEELKENLTLALSRTPDYDSGWRTINQNSYLTLTHNLGTTDLLVYVIGNDTSAWQYGIHQRFYGGALHLARGLYWRNLDTTSIKIFRLANDENWKHIRVMIWKISEPPT